MVDVPGVITAKNDDALVILNTKITHELKEEGLPESLLIEFKIFVEI